MNKSQECNAGKKKCTPNLLILGVQKSATTTLFDTLKVQSGFVASTKKEVHFFDSDINFRKGICWYLNHFPRSVATVKFEATPSYIYSKDAARRIHDTLEGTKFIVMLRDPVKRCLSAWNMFRNFNSDQVSANYIYENYIKQCNLYSRERLKNLLFSKSFPGFKQCVEADLKRLEELDVIEEPSFVRRGFYFDQIIEYLKYFKLENFLFLEQEEYEQDPISSLNEISHFLNIDIDLNILKSEVKSNVGDYKDISARDYVSTLLELYEIYKPHNEKLYSLLGRKFRWEPVWLLK